MSGFLNGVVKLGPGSFFQGGITTPTPPTPSSRWTAVVTDPTPVVSNIYTLTSDDDGKLFVLTNPPALEIGFADGSIPIGFSFGVVMAGSGDGAIAGTSASDHIFDENGDQTNAYGTSANPGGFFAELVKVASHEWQVIDKTGDWSAT